MVKILLDESINIKMRLEVLQMCFITVLVYDCQIWTYRTDQIDKIEKVQRKMERKLLGVTLRDRIRNEELRNRSGLVNAATEARKTKWRWGGHIMRMNQETWTYATTVWDQRRGKRRRGRPRRRCADGIMEELDKTGHRPREVEKSDRTYKLKGKYRTREVIVLTQNRNRKHSKTATPREHNQSQPYHGRRPLPRRDVMGLLLLFLYPA